MEEYDEDTVFCNIQSVIFDLRGLRSPGRTYSDLP